MTKLQRRVQEALDELVSTGGERGLQVCVYAGGEPVVDAIAGVADTTTGRPVGPDTPFYCYSVGKGMTSAVVHVLAERGVLDYDLRIVDLWPEYGRHGKERTTLRHVLTHSAGVPGIPMDTTIEELCDWDRICARIADAELWWEPGTAFGYHPYTFGYIAGEVVRRATGRPISAVLRDEISGPLGIAEELYFGVPEAQLPLLARLEDQPGAAEMMAEMPADLPIMRTAPGYAFPDAEFGNRRDILMADIPAGGKMSARAMARMYAAMLGEVDGVRLVSPERLAEITKVAVEGIDQVAGNPARMSLGYANGLFGFDPAATASVIGMGGAGGSYAYADAATGVTFAFTKNLLAMDFSAAERLIRIVREELG